MVKFDRIVLFNGETPTVTPLVLAGDVDYATHGFPPATEKEYIQQGIRILRPPNYNGPALYLNHTVHPFEMKEFRQALAYAIDRQQNGTVSLGESGKPPKSTWQASRTTLCRQLAERRDARRAQPLRVGLSQS
jgi:peptide/nickel transport system substrate-binding protein